MNGVVVRDLATHCNASNPMLEILKHEKTADVVVFQYPRGDTSYYHPQL